MAHQPDVTDVAASVGLRNPSVLDIDQLSVSFKQRGGASAISALKDVSVSIAAGEILGVVGESGSGKSMLTRSIVGLLPETAEATGSVNVRERDMFRLSPKELRRVRRYDLSLVLQDPATALNPVRTIETQFNESAKACDIHDARTKRERIHSSLSSVGLDGERVLKRFPFQLSGGMNQRVSIALALLNRPALLIADEPTTALDVTTQRSILRVLKDLVHDTGTSMMFVSHDLPAVKAVSDRILVLYGGRLVEIGPSDTVVRSPRHPYSEALSAAVPRVGSTSVGVSIGGYPKATLASDAGCPFRDRCDYAMVICTQHFPPYTQVSREHHAACWAIEEDN